MSLVLWILLGAAASFSVLGLFDSDNNDNSDTPPEHQSPPDAPVGEAGDDMVTYVTDGLVAEGGDGTDMYFFDPTATGYVSATLDGGAGDDIFSLAGLFDRANLDGGQISGGDGNDSIEVSESVFTNIFGDDGNDVIRIIGGPSSRADGGAGNDTLDGTGSWDVELWGGEGDDVILTDGYGSNGADYVISANGGVGNDTLINRVEIFPPPWQETEEDADIRAPILRGGEGADSFQFLLMGTGGGFTASPDHPPVFLNKGGIITDFEPGVDQIEIDLSDDFYARRYTIESGTFIENTAAGRTDIVIRLTTSSSNWPDQDILIKVYTTELSWDDINFPGAQPGSLLVA